MVISRGTSEREGRESPAAILADSDSASNQCCKAASVHQTARSVRCPPTSTLMKTTLLPLIVSVCFGATMVMSAPPEKHSKLKKPALVGGVVVPVPVVPPVVVVTPNIVVTLPGAKVPVAAPPPLVAPKPALSHTRFCGTERRHESHNFRGKGGVLYHCPGKGVPAGPPAPPRRR